MGRQRCLSGLLHDINQRREQVTDWQRELCAALEFEISFSPYQCWGRTKKNTGKCWLNPKGFIVIASQIYYKTRKKYVHFTSDFEFMEY